MQPKTASALENPLVTRDRTGLVCPSGEFHIDPLRPAKTAVVTHGHADHARSGSERYLATAASVPILRQRLGKEAVIEPLEYGETRRLGAATLSLHSAGHILGSAQIRIAHDDGRVWVVSGDYKRQRDPTCEPFEVVPCDVFVTETTFGLPVYRWPPMPVLVAEIAEWLAECRTRDATAVLFCYALGKAQRLLAELREHLDRPVWLHGAVQPLVECYRAAGVALPETRPVSERSRKERFAGDLVMAPPSAAGTPWLKRFPVRSTGFCSGWMRVRGNRRRRGFDRGFVLSDHADWPGLVRTVRETGAREIVCMHGKTDTLVRYLRELGIAARDLDELSTDAAL
ncbi:MAG: ligase-associated DNA damage response exonuclease [Pseudomonadota bacterium]